MGGSEGKTTLLDLRRGGASGGLKHGAEERWPVQRGGNLLAGIWHVGQPNRTRGGFGEALWCFFNKPSGIRDQSV